MATEEKKETAEVKPQYIGPFKVLGVTKVDDLKTPSGKEVVKIIFESGNMEQLMPLEMFQFLVTETPTDLTTLGDKKVGKIRDEVVKTLLEWDANAMELQTILQKVSNKISNVYDRVGHFLFTQAVYGRGRDSSWVPGANYTHYRTLIECDAVLKKVNEDGSAPINTPDA